MRIRTFGILTYLIVLSALTSQAYKLQFKDIAGASRTYLTSLHVQGTMDALDMSIPVDSSINMTSIEKVISKANSSSSISYSVTDGTVKATVTMPAEEEPEEINQPLPPFNLTYKRTPTGKVTNIKMTGDINPEIQQQIDSMNGQMQYPGQGLEFPDRNVEIGDSWNGTQKFKLDVGASLDMKVTYTLTEKRVVDGKTFLIIDCDINSKATDLPVKVPSPSGEGTITMKVSTNITGNQTVLFDPMAGEVGNSTMNMNIFLKMVIGGADGLTITAIMTMDGAANRA